MINIAPLVALLFQQLYSMDEIKLKSVAYFDEKSNVYMTLDRGRYSIGSLAVSGSGGYLMPQFSGDVKNCYNIEFRCSDIGIIKLAIPLKGLARSPMFLFNGYSHRVTVRDKDYLVVAKCTDTKSCRSSASPNLYLVEEYKLIYDKSGKLIEASIQFNGSPEDKLKYFHFKAITRSLIKI